MLVREVTPAAPPVPAATAPRDRTAGRSRGRRVAPAVLGGSALVALLVASMVVAVTVGPADLSAREVWSSIAHHLGFSSAPELSLIRDGIVWEIRFPRVLTAAAVGAGLAVSGAVMQALTRNPLADPFLLGLSSGASTGAVLVLLSGMAVVLPLAAFGGAMLAVVCTLLLARALGVITPSRTVLAGLAVSSFFSAITSLLIFVQAQGDSYRQVLNWLLGSLASTDWGSVRIAWITLLVVGIPVLLAGRVLDAFAFGDTAAAALGVPVSAVRWILLVATALLTGAMVSVSGSIGFVGLVLPNAVRLLVGARHRLLLPLSAVVGAIFMIWVDTAARTLFEPRELPVGIITVLVGAPVFVAVLLKNRDRA